jgi:hypothetical protein
MRAVAAIHRAIALPAFHGRRVYTPTDASISETHRISAQVRANDGNIAEAGKLMLTTSL